MISKNTEQLGGTYLTPGELTDCDPIVTVADLGVNNKNVKGKVMNASWPAIPCGLVAKSYFNDNYTLYAVDLNRTVTVNQKGIAWEDDRLNKYKNIQNPPNNLTWQDI